MLHNNEAIRQAVRDIIIYDALIPMRMVGELRTIVAELDAKIRDNATAVHSANAENKNMLALEISGICEITLEQSIESGEARITIDYKDLSISSIASGISLIKAGDALTNAAANNY